MPSAVELRRQLSIPPAISDEEIQAAWEACRRVIGKRKRTAASHMDQDAWETSAMLALWKLGQEWQKFPSGSSFAALAVTRLRWSLSELDQEANPLSKAAARKKRQLSREGQDIPAELSQPRSLSDPLPVSETPLEEFLARADDTEKDGLARVEAGNVQQAVRELRERERFFVEAYLQQGGYSQAARFLKTDYAITYGAVRKGQRRTIHMLLTGGSDRKNTAKKPLIFAPGAESPPATGRWKVSPEAFEVICRAFHRNGVNLEEKVSHVDQHRAAGMAGYTYTHVGAAVEEWKAGRRPHDPNGPIPFRPIVAPPRRPNGGAWAASEVAFEAIIARLLLRGIDPLNRPVGIRKVILEETEFSTATYQAVIEDWRDGRRPGRKQAESVRLPYKGRSADRRVLVSPS